MISLDQILVKSSYLEYIEEQSNGDFFIYHSLFGNIHYIDSSCMELIHLFSSPININEALMNHNNPKLAYELIEEFYSLYYLIPKGFDERTLTEKQLAKRLKELDEGKLINAIQLNVSEGCNLKCTYCFADRVDERSNPFIFGNRNDKRFMSIETAKQSIEAITNLVLKHGNNNLVIKFFGREPLLNWQVIEKIITFFGSKRNGVNYHYSITTNGTLFTPEIVNKLKEVDTDIVVSLDGLAEANILRVTKSGKETFSLVDCGLEILKKHQVSCTVASVLTEENFDYVSEEFLDYLNSKSIVKQWEVKLAMQNDDNVKRSSSEYAEKLLNLCIYGNNLGIQVTGDWYDPFVTLYHTTKRRTDKNVQRLAPNSCSATDHQISIEPSGSVFGCRALDTKLGEVDNLDTLFKSSTYKHLSMRTYYNVPFCHGCKLEGFCQGVCLGHSERKFQDIYQPDNNYCNVYREVFDLLLKNYLIDK